MHPFFQAKRFRLFVPILILVLAISALAGPAVAQEEINTVEVELYEWGIDMPEELPAGRVRFQVTNTGDFPHNLRIQGQDLNRAFNRNLQTGITRYMTVTLEPGTYTVDCPIGNHAEQGMLLELTVTEQQDMAQEATETPDMEQEATEAPDMKQEATEQPDMEEEGQVPTTGQPSGTVMEPIENTMPIGLESVAEGFTSPIFLTNAGDGSGRLFVLDQVGQIRIIDENGELIEEPFLDLSDRMVEIMENFDERGLLGLAFHPDYSENGRFFVYYSAPLREEAPDDWNHTGLISEFSVSEDDPNQADPDSERVLLRIDQPQFNHDGGTVMFGPDGYLYISLGDGGGADDTGTGHVEDWYEENEGGNGQDVTQNLLGSILRIDVDDMGNNNTPFGIPEDNPFVDQEGRDTIFAYGFRNPYRFSFDRGGENQMYVADVGQNSYEEVSVVENGGNYGWNVYEGTHCFDAANPDQHLDECPTEDPMGNEMQMPVIEYLNANQEGGVGISITGGYVYRGEAIADLQGNYVFGDWSRSFDSPQGRLFMSEPQEGEGLWPMVELIPEGMEFNYFVLGFGEDEDGELYVTTSQSSGPTGSTGEVFRFVPAGEAEVPVTGDEMVIEDDMAHAEELWTMVQDAGYQENWSTLPNLGEFYRGLAPHGDLLSTYLNEAANTGFEETPGEMPDQSIIVKENYNADRELQAISIMEKVAGYDAEHGDWFYGQYGPDGEVMAAGQVDGCTACHGAVQSNDYIFTFPVAPIEP